MHKFLLLMALGASACATTPLQPIQTERGRDARWHTDRYPLTIAFVARTAVTSYPFDGERHCRERIVHFAAEFNRVSGRTLFRETLSSREEADIVVVSTEPRRLAFTTLVLDGRGTIKAAEIEIPCTMRRNGSLAKLIAHEMLHSLGFDHNKERFAKIMHALGHDLRLPNLLADELRGLTDPDATLLDGPRSAIAAR